jgi:diguanylate cyclase (GGDEF)-like protein
VHDASVILDLGTIVAVLIMSTLLLAATLALGVRSRHQQGLAKWIWGLGVQALGWTLLALGAVLPELVAIAAADALLLAGLSLQYAAILEHGGRVVRPWLPLVPGPLLFLALVPMLPDHASSTLVASLSSAAVLLAICVATASLKAEGVNAGSGRARWLLVGVCGAGAITLSARAVAPWLAPEPQMEIFSVSLLDKAAFMMCFAMTVGASFAFLLMHRDRAESELRRLAMFDSLTGLFNRRAFMELAGRELARAERSGVTCALLMMDLDLFKRVNDDFGHQAGDRVLADFAATVERCLRTGDLAGRYGGEEFCALLLGTDSAKLIAVAERIRAAACARALGGLPRITTVSIGATICVPGEHATLEAGIARADRALYEAKRGGRNRVACLDPSMSASPPTELQLSAA